LERRIGRIAFAAAGGVLVAAFAIGLALVATVNAGPAHPAPAPFLTYTGYLGVGGVQRTYRVVRPAQPPRGLVIALHGYGGDGRSFEQATGFDRQAVSDHLVVVYPDGIGRAWNAGFCCPFASAPTIDDVAFLSALADRLQPAGTPTFLAGFSNGGMLAYHAACRLPKRFAAIAVIGADSEECSPKGPLPAILAIQGTSDALTGERVWGMRSGTWVNVEASAPARWKRLGAEVRVVSVPGGVHEWYRQNPDASQLAADFFASKL
jgi:poly(3-hydroxybutyrate) depolymerase